MFDKAPVSSVWAIWSARRDAASCIARYRANAVNRKTHRSARALLLDALVWRVRYETRVYRVERKARKAATVGRIFTYV